VRRCSFHRILAELAHDAATGAPRFALVDVGAGPAPPVPVDVIPRMDAWADGMTHALLELRSRGPRGRAWLLDAAGVGSDAANGTACLFQTRDAAAPGRRHFVVANLAALADRYRAAASGCDARAGARSLLFFTFF
jgi:hypothetical protein